LQDAGLIRYRRGHIAVLERAGLETRSCECYTVVRNELDRLLPGAHTDRLAHIPARVPIGSAQAPARH
jgi:hypothetical protein